jgi:hypothetical protein
MALALAIIGVLVGIALGLRFNVVALAAAIVGRDVCPNSRSCRWRESLVTRPGCGDSRDGY